MGWPFSSHICLRGRDVGQRQFDCSFLFPLPSRPEGLESAYCAGVFSMNGEASCTVQGQESVPRASAESS